MTKQRGKTVNEIMKTLYTPMQWRQWLKQWENSGIDTGWTNQILEQWEKTFQFFIDVQLLVQAMGDDPDGHNYDRWSITWNQIKQCWEFKLVFIDYKSLYDEVSGNADSLWGCIKAMLNIIAESDAKKEAKERENDQL